MVRVVMYGTNPEEMAEIREGLAAILRERQRRPVFREFTGPEEREAFLQYVKNNPYLVMLLLQPAPAAAETALLAREANPKARFVWFCEHNYALYAFALHATFFELLPVDRKKLETAADACGIYAGSVISLAQNTPFPQL